MQGNCAIFVTCRRLNGKCRRICHPGNSHPRVTIGSCGVLTNSAPAFSQVAAAPLDDAALGAVLSAVSDFLHNASTSLPVLLALVLKCISDACDGVKGGLCGSDVLPASYVCLRKVCPALVQAQALLSESMQVSENVANALRLVAKALQLAANGVEPSADSAVAGLRDRLPAVRAALQHFAAQAALAAPEHPASTPRSLVEAAVELYRRALLVEGAEALLAPLKLGVPPSRDALEAGVPPLVLEVRRKLAGI